jgi:putative endonuclease
LVSPDLFRASASAFVSPMRPFEPCVYLLANRYRGALYTGVTSDLLGRIHQHREQTFGGYTADRVIKQLVWFERHQDIEVAIRREKTIKRWPRQWKFSVIEEINPDWRDLAVDFGFPVLETKRKPRPGTSPG